MRKLFITFLLCFLSVTAEAQWQVPNNTIPIGRGTGVSGFKSAANTGTGTLCLLNTLPPSFGTCILTPPGGTNGQIQYNNSSAFSGLTNLQVAARVSSAVPAVAYGMLCDGATNDATALTNALNAAITAGYGNVILPAGICVINSAVNVSAGTTGNGLSITGQGLGATKLYFPNGGGLGIQLNSANHSSPLTISDFTLYNGRNGVSNGDYALTVTNNNSTDIATYVVVKNIAAENYNSNTGWWYAGLHFVNISNVMVTNFFYNGNTSSRQGYGIKGEGTLAPTSIINITGGVVNWTDISYWFVGSHYEGINITGVNANATNKGVVMDFSGVAQGQCTVTNSQFSPLNIGISMGFCQGGTISGNTLLITNSGGINSGIYLENTLNMALFGNIVYGNGAIPALLLGAGTANIVKTGFACTGTTSC